MTTKIKCPECLGAKKVKYSCCGVKVSGTMWEDYNICPLCKEHLSDEEETCEICNGEGEVEDEGK